MYVNINWLHPLDSAAKPPVKKWKSSFKPVDGGDDSEEQDAGSSTGYVEHLWVP